MLGCLPARSATAQVAELTPASRVSMLTCSPGDQLYSIFGHTAIRIVDPISGVDRVYNYGTFDFNTPNFYLKFARGRLKYMLDVSTYAQFERIYRYEGRKILEQVLELPLDERQELYDALENNALPDNKYYSYDFFYDNCSTRPRDMLAQNMGEKLKLDFSRGSRHESFRTMIDRYLEPLPWADFGIDLALGMPTDKVASGRERLFLPDEVFFALEDAQYMKGEEPRQLVQQTRVLLKAQGEKPERPWFTPGKLFWFIFALVAVYSFFGNPQRGRWLNFTLFLLTGILGVLIALLWFATDHHATRYNLNLIWALPTHLWGAWLILRRSRLSRYYFFVVAIINFGLIIFWITLPQNLHYAVAPIVLMLTLRAWNEVKKAGGIKFSKLT